MFEERVGEDRESGNEKKHARICLVNLGALGQFAVGLQTPGLIGTVLEYDVALFVLVVAQAEHDNVALVDPDFFAQFTPNVRESLFAIKAQRFQSAVAQHLKDLCVLYLMVLRRNRVSEREQKWTGKGKGSVGSGRTLAFFFKCQFALFVVVFVFATTSIFPSLVCGVSPKLQQMTRTPRLDYPQPFEGRALTFPLFLGISTSFGCDL